MSNDFNSARSVMDESRKLAEKLEEMAIERHITIMEMLKAQLSLRIADLQNKAKADHQAAMAEQAEAQAAKERQAKFGVV